MRKVIVSVLAVLVGVILIGLSTPAYATPVESHTSTAAARSVYPLRGEGLISLTARACGTSAVWRSVASANRVYGPAFVIYYGTPYAVSCVRLATTTASRSTAPRTTYVRPVAGSGTSSCYGWRASTNSFHQGIDLPRPLGTTIRAVHPGRVVSAGWNGGYGREVVIYHGGNVWTQYAHASSLLARAGQNVNTGTPIARVGTSGHSFGYHLHWEVRTTWIKHRIDPAPWARSHGIGMGC